MNLNALMSRMTLRQLETADALWRAEVGDDGPKLEEAMQAGNRRAVAAMIAARLRLDGSPDMTVDQAMDVEFDLAADTAGEASGGNGGGPPRLSPAPGP